MRAYEQIEWIEILQNCCVSGKKLSIFVLQHSRIYLFNLFFDICETGTAQFGWYGCTQRTI
jgi:hypothetical protein